jgi:O-antigen/teichoic acid export membrane protein
MYTMLTAAKVPEEFNADYYIGIVTILPILMLAVGVLANFAQSIPLEVERRWKRPRFYLISFFYNFTPILSAVGIIMGILALMFRYTSTIYEWFTFILLGSVIVFLAFASYVYLRAFDGDRQRGRAAMQANASSGA